MLSKASPAVKTKVRGFLGIGDVFLITKESEKDSITKYKKQAESEKDRADALAQEVAELRKLAGSNGVKKGPAELTTSVDGKSPNRRMSSIGDILAEDPLPKDADSAKARSWEVLVAVLLVLAAQALGYTAGLSHAQSLGQNTLASGGGTLAHLVTGDSPDFVNDALDLGDDAIDGATTTLKATTTAMGGILVTEHGQATTLSIALVLSSIVLAPIMLTGAGSRVVMVLTAAMPTAYVWLLPVASKLGFANSMEVLMSHGEADVVGVLTTPQATGWMVALYSLPLFALLRIADVGGRGPQYKDRSMDAGGRGPLRSTGVATVVLFYLWLLVGCWMRAPVRYSFPAHGETREENTEYLRAVGRPIPPGAEFQVSPPYATFTFPFRHPEHPGALYADLVLFALTMVALAAHALTHRANRRIGRGGAVLCIFLPCLSAFVVLAFSADGYYRAKWGAWGEGALFDAWPLAVSQALGLTGLAFLPLLLLPEQTGVAYNTKIVQRRAGKLNSGRSLFAPLVAFFTFVTLPEVFRRYSFLADSNIHVDSRMDLSDPDILGAPCSAVDGAASLSSYVDSPFYAVLLALVFFFPLLDMSASSEKKSKVVKFDSALSHSLCVALALFVAFPLSYDAELHRAISVAFFIIAAARAVTEGFAAPKVVAILCVLKFFAAIGAILVNVPLTAKYIPAFHLGGYVPCLDATPWVAESAALGLVLLTTTVNIFMSRHENNDRYKHLAGSTLY